MKKILILGSSGFLGQHLEYRMKAEGHYVVSVARSYPKHRKSIADENNILDLANTADFHAHFFRHHFDAVYQLAGSVGGLSYIGTGANDSDILSNSFRINMNTLEAIRNTGNCDKVFFASSQCVYPDKIEVDPYAAERLVPRHVTAIGAHKETDASFNTFAFGQEKLYAEKLYDAYSRNYGIKVRVGRMGNLYSAYCPWAGTRAKAVAAICRKVAQAPYAGTIKMFGDGQQRRSFTYVDDAIDGMIKLMESDYDKPVNIAHAETVTIAELFEEICRIANKILAWEPTEGPVGVRNRGSDNTLCRQVLDGWEPMTSLWNGLALTYPWIREQVEKGLTKTAG
jgi:GDP-D-mannose 3', 5'-epimerase